MNISGCELAGVCRAADFPKCFLSHALSPLFRDKSGGGGGARNSTNDRCSGSPSLLGTLETFHSIHPALLPLSFCIE